jgi:hypothetical protein
MRCGACGSLLGMPEELTLAELRQKLDVPATTPGLVQSALKTIVDALISLDRRVSRLEKESGDDRRIPGLL